MSSIEAAKNPRDIILRPVVTEKSSILMDQGKYTFEVDPRSNKTEIKMAVEAIFGVRLPPWLRRTARARFTALATESVRARMSSAPS